MPWHVLEKRRNRPLDDADHSTLHAAILFLLMAIGQLHSLPVYQFHTIFHTYASMATLSQRDARRMVQAIVPGVSAPVLDFVFAAASLQQRPTSNSSEEHCDSPLASRVPLPTASTRYALRSGRDCEALAFLESDEPLRPLAAPRAGDFTWHYDVSAQPTMRR